MRRTAFCFLILTSAAFFGCRTIEEIKVIHEVIGPIETNCYLIYGMKSKQAALIDPGGQVDNLIASIKENGLELKYIFVTHGHIDHVFGIPNIKNLFPKAKLCMHKDEYRDLFTQEEWAIKNYGDSWLEEVKSTPETAIFLDFDMKSIGEPDIFVEDNKVFRLGSIKIKAIHSPGHSPGGMCYHTDNILFTGDVLFYRSVGRIDTQNGSKEAQIRSVRKLYDLFADSTIVYPGHGQFTDIGSEKKENKYVSIDGGKWVIQ